MTPTVPTGDWQEHARAGRSLAAIVAYRSAVGVGLSEAKDAVERWLAINLPPSVDYQHAARIGRRVTELLNGYFARTGRALAFWVQVVPANPADIFGHPALLHAELPEGHAGHDLAVLIELPDVTRRARRHEITSLLATGVRMVWAIETDVPTVNVVTDPDDHPVYLGGATFTGGDVLPGFSCKVADLFA